MRDRIRETLGQRVKRLREAREMSQPALARNIPGMSASAISQLEIGHSKGVRPDNLIGLARALGITPEELVEGEGRRSAQQFTLGIREVPVVGFAVATPEEDGYFDDMGLPEGGDQQFVPWQTKDPHAYALRVRGDSMQPRIRPGEFIVVEPNAAVAPGHDVLVRTRDGRRMVKQLLWKRDGEIALGSINQAHRQTTLTAAEVESIHFVAGISSRTLIRE